MASKSVYRDINEKCLELKNKSKNLWTMLSNIFEINRNSNNNKLIFIKRNVDKLKLASKYVLAMEDILVKDNLEENVSLNNEVKKTYSETLKNINKLNSLLKRQYSFAQKDKFGSSSSSIRNNIDNLRLAINNLRHIDPSMNLTKDEWIELEERYKNSERK